jgi:hypothetical protein
VDRIELNSQDDTDDDASSPKAKTFKKQLFTNGPDLSLLPESKDAEMDCTSQDNPGFPILYKRIDQVEINLQNVEIKIIIKKQELIRLYYQLHR